MLIFYFFAERKNKRSTRDTSRILSYSRKFIEMLQKKLPAKSGFLAVFHDDVGNFVRNILSRIQHFFQNSIKFFVTDQIACVMVFQK